MPQLLCQGIDQNIGLWGKCLIETAFFGDVVIYSIFMLAMFALVSWRFNLPGAVVLPMSSLYLFGLWLTVGGTPFIEILLIISVVINMVFLGLAIIEKVNIR